jgi:hypothetical protein
VAKNKTVATTASVSAFLKGIVDARQRADVRALMAIIRKATGKRATMWGDAIVGFGRYDYRYASGREGSFFLVGLAPRAQNIAVYIMPGFASLQSLLQRLGPHRTGKSCLYIKSLAALDRDVLTRIIERSVALMRERHGPG